MKLLNALQKPCQAGCFKNHWLQTSEESEFTFFNAHASGKNMLGCYLVQLCVTHHDTLQVNIKFRLRSLQSLFSEDPLFSISCSLTGSYLQRKRAWYTLMSFWLTSIPQFIWPLLKGTCDNKVHKLRTYYSQTIINCLIQPLL